MLSKIRFCIDCGELFYINSPSQKRCENCAKKVNYKPKKPKVQKCVDCRIAFVPKCNAQKRCDECSKINTRTSRAKKYKKKLLKSCKECGEMYSGKGRFCSDKCRNQEELRAKIQKHNCPKCKYSFKAGSMYICCYYEQTGDSRRCYEEMSYPCNEFSQDEG